MPRQRPRGALNFVVPALIHSGQFSLLCFQPDAVSDSVTAETSQPTPGRLCGLRPCEGRSLYMPFPRRSSAPMHPTSLAPLGDSWARPQPAKAFSMFSTPAPVTRMHARDFEPISWTRTCMYVQLTRRSLAAWLSRCSKRQGVLGQRQGGKPPWTPQLVTPSPLHLCSLVQLAHAPHALANRVYSYAYFLHKTRGRHTHYSSRESTFETQS